MAFEPMRVVESRQAAKYDGTNSADFNNAISDFTIVAEDASGLTFTSGGVQYTVAVDGYVTWYQGTVTAVYQNQNDFDGAYGALIDEHVHDLILTSGPAKAPEPAA